MLIERMYNSTAVTYREGFVSGSTIKKTYVAFLPTFSCHIQPLEPTLGQGMPGMFGKQWVMFCPVADFKEGDKVIVNSIDEYRIAGVEKLEYGGNKHAEIVLRMFDE